MQVLLKIEIDRERERERQQVGEINRKRYTQEWERERERERGRERERWVGVDWYINHASPSLSSFKVWLWSDTEKFPISSLLKYFEYLSAGHRLLGKPHSRKVCSNVAYLPLIGFITFIPTFTSMRLLNGIMSWISQSCIKPEYQAWKNYLRYPSTLAWYLTICLLNAVSPRILITCLGFWVQNASLMSLLWLKDTFPMANVVWVFVIQVTTMFWCAMLMRGQTWS